MTVPLKQFSTPIHCCSIETIPHGDNMYFACGMYELLEDSKRRSGKVALCDENGIFFEMDVTAGVLDMKFNGSTVACALSSGDIGVYQHSGRELHPVQHIVADEDCDEGLALSVGWSPNYSVDVNTPASHFVVSSENGSIQIYTLEASGYRLSRNIPQAHMLMGECVPTWIAAYNVHDDNVIVSGGDDMAIRLWDIRSATPVYQSNRHFSAGVTSAEWHPLSDHAHVLAVGSYDGSIKLWDDRQMRQPLTDMQTGASTTSPPCAAHF